MDELQLLLREKYRAILQQADDMAQIKQATAVLRELQELEQGPEESEEAPQSGVVLLGGT